MSSPAPAANTTALRQALQRIQQRLQANPDDGRALDEAAVLLYQAGQLKHACDFARRAALACPRDPFVLDHLGVILLAAEHPAEAVDAARRATTIAPREGAFWINLGNAQLAAGDCAAAAESLAMATRLAPHEARAWYNLGNAQTKLARPAEAIRTYRKALDLAPSLAPARRNLAIQLRVAARFAEAAAILAPLATAADADLLQLLGNLHLEASTPAEALPPLERARAIRPGDTGILLDLARCYVRLGRLAEAAPLCRKLTEQLPENATVWNLHGLCSGETSVAISAFARALVLRPSQPDATVNLSRRLVDDGRPAEALPWIEAAIAHVPDNAELHCTRAVVLRELGRTHDALAAYDAALAAQPAHHGARWNRALCLLRLGHYAEGWHDYEFRWSHDASEKGRYGHLPRWPESNPRHGHLLLWAEQGVGDEVMFSTLLPQVVPLVDRISVACCARLVPLLGRSHPGINFIAQDSDRSVPSPSIAADWQLPLGSLPMRVWTRSGHPGRGAPTLRSEANRVAQLRARYKTDQRPVIGIAWRTSNAVNGRARTITPELWATALRDLPVRLVSLQYGDTSAELAAAATAGVVVEQDPSVDQLRDLDLFAAQIAALDGVLTIDNSTAHFAGALGIPTWLLLPTPPDWRWCDEGNNTTWYASLRLCRRPPGSTWAPVLHNAAADIRHFFAERSSAICHRRTPEPANAESTPLRPQ